MTVSSLVVVSFDPPLIAVSIANASRKGESVLASDEFKIRLLRTGEEAAVIDCNEMPGPCLTAFDCRVDARIPTGDHTLVIAEVTDLSLSEGFPIVYWRKGVHPLKPQYPLVSSRREFDRFIASFEDRSLSRAEWTHAAHVAIAAWYSIRDHSTAYDRVKRGIMSFNEASGVLNTETSGYHETLTVLWLAIVAEYVTGISDPFEAARLAVTKFAEDRDLHCLYYSSDVVRDCGARKAWIAPDRIGPFKLHPTILSTAAEPIVTVLGD